MIRYSHVSLSIPCEPSSAATITETLGVQPTRVRQKRMHKRREDGSWEETFHYTWMLDSPKGHAEGDPAARLYALADRIEPFAVRLSELRPHFRVWIDISYQITPEHTHGVTGEFNWLRMPAELMRRFGAWELDVAYSGAIRTAIPISSGT
jgi:hypothetical protein